SIMPCTAKKSEIHLPENLTGDYPDVDAVLTTRECGRLIKMYGMDLAELPDSEFDQDLFGEYTGAGVIFGVTGGVMEAALRTVAEVLEGKSFENVDYEAVRGLQGVKEATLNIAGLEVRIAVASSMVEAKPLLDQVRAGESPYHFIEIMGCPGGCINGGGQSIIPSKVKNKEGIDVYRAKRASALYEEDVIMPVRKSHENKQIQELYQNFLGEPGSHISHKLLHTTYAGRDRFSFEK
ncbi:MAG: iron hydrogenase small subunit, partial [Firmicutes bacterium]|nr:iron hydrogenase small subunit [Bacillota bacterium]